VSPLPNKKKTIQLNHRKIEPSSDDQEESRDGIIQVIGAVEATETGMKK